MSAAFRHRFIAISLAAAIDGPWLLPGRVDGQTVRLRSVIDGVVSDTNLVGLSEATIGILGSPVRVVTGESGRFRINGVSAGQYIVTVHRVGYMPVSSVVRVGESDTLRLAFALNPITTALDTVVVTATKLVPRLSGFEARRKFGFGTFLTQEDIERRRAIFVTDVLRTLPDVRIVWKLRDGDTAVNTRFGGGCAFQIVVDEILQPTADLTLLPSPRDIAAMEVYFDVATIPLQYRTANSRCGMIIVWTKGG